MRKPSWTSFSIMMLFLALLAAASCAPTRGTGAALPLDQNPIPAALTPAPSATLASDWLTFTNTKYGFEFRYPNEGKILGGRTDNYARIKLPFMPGTNLSEKYLEVIVVDNVNPCRSPLGTSSAPQTSETVIIGLRLLMRKDQSANVLESSGAKSASEYFDFHVEMFDCKV